MNAKALLVIVIGLGTLAALSVFTVDQREVAILLQFGKVERTDLQPGLHFKVPVVQNVMKFDLRIQTLDSDPQNYLTFEKKNVIVDSFVKWRIADVRRFYTSAGGDIRQANNRLGEVILKRLRDEFGKRTIQQVVSGQRNEIMDELLIAADDQADELGLEIVDVRIKRVDLPSDVSQSVYNRMRAERQEVAKRFRSEGEEQARQLRATANKDREIIIAEADRDAQITRGAGDAQATETYASAFGQDREFYKFYRSLDAYRTTFGSTSDILLLEPKGEFFDYFKGAKAQP